MKKQSDYTTADLSRALIRQYLSQRGLKSTLATFERQDSDNKKKISKNLLIDMLSVKHLCLLNKQQAVPQNTYLNKKYQTRKLVFAKTQPQIFSQNDTQKSKKQPVKQQTMEIPNDKFVKKDRPSTGKQRNKPVVQLQTKPVLKFEKDQLKVIYQKVTKPQNPAIQKIQEAKQLPKKEETSFKIAQNTEKVNSIKKTEIQPLKVQDEYQQNFEDQKEIILKKPPSLYKIQQKLVSVPPSLLTVQQQLVSLQPSLPPLDGIIPIASKQAATMSKKLSKEEKIQPRPSSAQQKPPSLLEIPKNLESKVDYQEEQVKKIPQTIRQSKIQPNPIILVEKPPENTGLNKKKHSENQKSEVIKDMLQQNGELESKRLNSNTSEQKINTLPIVLCDQPMVLGLKSKHSKDVNQYQLQANIKIKDSSAIQQQVHSRPSRTMMRPLAKNKDSTKLLNEVISNSEEVPAQIAHQAKKEQKQQKMASISQLKSEGKIEQQVRIKQKQQIKGGSGQLLMAIGKKRKNKEESSEADYPTKFKFDQNFTHQIQKEEIYQYQPFNIDKFLLEDKCDQKYPKILFHSEINYKQKGGGVVLHKKKPEKMIATKDAQRLKTVTFQSGPSNLPKSWTQGFILSPFQTTPYGLKQIEGGPCGIIAAVQCYFLKHLLYCSKESNFADPVLRQTCLIAAIADILYKVKSGDKITLAFPPKGATKIDINNLRIAVIDANNFQAAFSGLWANREQYLGQKNFGVAALLFTVILTKGIENIEAEIDNKENPLIGNHGHCTQEFVNLLLTGKATSNCFDGDKVLDDYKLKGIGQKAQFGFLTIFETLKYIEVGKNLKNPVFPVWVICKQFHYHVIFAAHHLVSSNNKSPKFDIVYFDGLYNCGDRIRLTLESISFQEQQQIKVKDLPLIQQVMMTKWGVRKTNWNGSTKIL